MGEQDMVLTGFSPVQEARVNTQQTLVRALAEQIKGQGYRGCPDSHWNLKCCFGKTDRKSVWPKQQKPPGTPTSPCASFTGLN